MSEGHQEQHHALTPLVADGTNPPRLGQERHALLFETIDDGFCVIEMIFDAANQPVDYRFREFNTAFTRLTGITPADALSGKTVKEIFPNHESFWFETYGRVAVTGESAQFENYARAMDTWFAVTAVRVGGDGSREVSVLFRDISQRKLDEQSRSREKAWLDRVLQTARIATFDWDVNHDRVYTNVLLGEFFDVDADENAPFPLQRYVESIHPDDRAATKAAIDEALATGGHYEIRYRVYGRGGRMRWVLARGDATEEPQGKRLSGVVLDITEQTRIEEKERAAAEMIARNEEVFRTIFEQAKDDAILVTNTSRELSAWNPAAERITGWKASDVLGTPADLIFTPEDRANALPEKEMATASREGKAVDERWHIRADGSRFWGSGTMNALHDAAGKVRGYLKVLRDATAKHEEDETRQFLSRLTDRVIGQRDPEQIIKLTLAMLGEHLNVSRVLVAEASADQEFVTITQCWSPNLPPIAGTHRLADYGQILLENYRSGRIHVYRDATKEYSPDAVAAQRKIGTIAGIDVPVYIGQKMRALFVVHNVEPRDWTDGEITLVRQVADRLMAEVERARALGRLEKSEAQFRELADAMPQIVFAATPEGHVDYFNRQWYEYTGTPDGSIGFEYWQHVHEQARLPAILTRWQSALATGEPYEIEYPLRRADGVFRWHLGRALPVRNERGQIVRWFGTNTDIHDQKLTEAALRQAQERFTIAVDAADLGTFHWVLPETPETIYDWNDKLREFFWMKPGELVDPLVRGGKLAAEDHDRVQAALGRALRGEEPYNIEYQIVGPQGQRRYLRVLGRAFGGTPGHPERFTGVAMDITAQKAAEKDREQLLAAEKAAREEAERQGRMKDEFLATLSHELRTPLNAIVGWSQLLMSSHDDSETLDEGLSVIDRNARAQSQIIEDILDMSRIIAGRLRLDVQKVELAAIVQAGIDTVQHAATAKGVRISAVLDPMAGMVMGDPNRLHQIFWNILSNAVKFTPRDGRIQVSLERVNSQVEISISDSGEGIEIAFLPFVFDRFRQADATTTRRHGGLGLGLSIVKQLVEMHGGTVSARSAGKSMGATFVISLPVTIAHSESEPSESIRETSRSVPTADEQYSACEQLQGIQVLAVDDEPDGQLIVRRLLEACGATVRTAGSAADALRLLESEPPMVLISDVGMPGEDGYDLIRKIRALPASSGGNVPAVALTAYARASDRIRAMEAGFQAHFAKPVEPAELIVTVAAMARLSDRSDSR